MIVYLPGIIMITEKLGHNLLSKRLQQGDEKAFKELFETFYPSLCLFAGHYLKDESEAVDIVQESFLKYWNRREDFDNYAQIKSFLYIVVQHACLNVIRDQHHHASLDDISKEDSLTEFHDYLIEEEAHRIFNLAVDHLPLQLRTVIQYVLEGLKVPEIARKMNIAESSVITYKKEAYKRLRTSLKEHYYLLTILFFMDKK